MWLSILDTANTHQYSSGRPETATPDLAGAPQELKQHSSFRLSKQNHRVKTGGVMELRLSNKEVNGAVHSVYTTSNVLSDFWSLEVLVFVWFKAKSRWLVLLFTPRKPSNGFMLPTIIRCLCYELQKRRGWNFTPIMMLGVYVSWVVYHHYSQKCGMSHLR